MRTLFTTSAVTYAASTETLNISALRLRPHIHIFAVITLLYLLFTSFVFAQLPVKLDVDSYEYIESAKLSPTSMAFWTDLRSGGMPLIIHIFGNDHTKITIFQLVISQICWLILAGVVARLIQVPVLRVVAFATILMFSATRDIFFWNSGILSESLTHSLFALMVAACLVFTFRTYMEISTQIGAALVLLVIMAAWVLLRDTNIYFLLGFVVLLLPLIRKYPAMIGVLLICTVIMFFAQSHSADEGTRWQRPVINSIGERILTDEEKTQYFMDRGMPEEARSFENKRAWDGDTSVFQPWLTEKGKKVYMGYLLTHPFDTFPAPILEAEDTMLLGKSIIPIYMNNIDSPALYNFLSDIIYTRHIWWVALSAATLGLLGYCTYYHGLDYRMYIPICLLIMVYPMAFIVYHGDAVEVKRHSLPVALQWRLGMWLILFFALDRILAYRTVKRKS